VPGAVLPLVVGLALAGPPEDASHGPPARPARPIARLPPAARKAGPRGFGGPRVQPQPEQPEPGERERPYQRPKHPQLALANTALENGSAQTAAMLFRRQVAWFPESGPAHVGLGRALARTGACEEALEHLAPWMTLPAFTVPAAQAASACAARLGLLEDALGYDAVAVDLDPRSVPAWTQYAVHLARAGDDAGVLRAYDALLTAIPDRDASGFARATVALLHGDLDAVDVESALWARDGVESDDITQLRMLAALDAGDPDGAAEHAAALPRARRPVGLRLAAAEVARRRGEIAEAALQLDGTRIRPPIPGADADALRVRIRVDEGDLAGAVALLDTLAGEDTADVEASRWYVARARGDAAAMSDHAARWRAREPSRARSLDQLLPTDRRAR
jgi:tetratricopeptide (TPR) repeat protein